MPNTNEIKTLLTDDNGQFYTPANNGEPATIKDESGNVIATSLDSVTWSPKAMHCDNDEPEKINVVDSDDSDKVLYAITPADLDNALSEALQAAKDNLKAPLEDINTSKTILEMTLEVLQSEVAEYPLLQYFIDYLEPFKVDHILGEINAYRDAHARVMTTTWHVLLANDPSMSSLALRARLDIDIWGNYSDETYIAHWEDLVLPWLRHRSQYFSPHLVAAEALPEAVPEADAPVAD